MADKVRGYLRAGRLAPADARLEISGNVEVRGSANQRMRRLDLGRFRVVGDANQTMTTDSSDTSDIDGTVLYFNAAITAARTVTVLGANAVTGMRWLIVRSAAATGAFDIDVGPGLKTLSAASTWCELTYEGTVWLLTSSGSL